MSIATLSLTWLLWRRQNRPVVSAFVEEHSAGNISIAYRLVVTNAGTRPAKDIRLSVTSEDLLHALATGVESSTKARPLLDSIRRCFSDDGLIPILLNNDRVQNSFGLTSLSDSIWRPGASLPIEIVYSDLEDRRYQSRIRLRLRDRNAFAGSMWSE